MLAYFHSLFSSSSKVPHSSFVQSQEPQEGHPKNDEIQDKLWIPIAKQTPFSSSSLTNVIPPILVSTEEKKEKKSPFFPSHDRDSQWSLVIDELHQVLASRQQRQLCNSEKTEITKPNITKKENFVEEEPKDPTLSNKREICFESFLSGGPLTIYTEEEENKNSSSSSPPPTLPPSFAPLSTELKALLSRPKEDFFSSPELETVSSRSVELESWMVVRNHLRRIPTKKQFEDATTLHSNHEFQQKRQEIILQKNKKQKN